MRITERLVSSSSAAVTEYIPVPYEAKVLSGYCTVSGDPGAELVVTLKSGATSIGTFTIANGASAAEIDAYVPDTTNGKTSVSATVPLTISIAQSTNDAIVIHFVLDLDEFARTT